MSRGHVPMRSCVVCGAKTDKRDLVRLVRTQAGRVEVDGTSRVPGRGAYLCHRQTCWESALKKNRLDYALRVQIPATERQLLLSYAQTQLERE